MRKIAKAKARKLSEERELLGRCDGLATTAGRESENDRVTIYNIDMQRLMRSAESVRLGIVLRGPQKLG